ncbi:hypothetical protein HYV43_06130 [Candidatus Micrarchaeota archaeon]|nr:hypothetical protein [Candidatus Micrarchaeota archaeon]
MQSSSSSPSAVSTSGMTLYNLNKWPVGFANPEAEEKPFKEYIEAQVKGKYIPVENGLPPKDGVTIDASYPDSSASFSLLKLSGTTLSAQTYCQSGPTISSDASSSAGSTRPASCEEQQKYTQELLAYVLDEGRDSTELLKKCKLTQTGDKQASAICDGTTPTATGGHPAQASPSRVLTDAKQLGHELRQQAERQGLDLTCISAVKVNVKPGSFDGKGGKIDFTIQLKNAPVSTPPAATGTASSAASSAPASGAQPAPAVFFSISLQSVQLKEGGKPANFDDWVPAWPGALWSKYCVNAGEGKKNFGATDKDKACNEVEPDSPIYKALQAALKAETPLSLDLEKDLKIKVAGMKGKVPAAERKKEEKPAKPDRNPTNGDLPATRANGDDIWGRVYSAPYSSIDYGEPVAAGLFFVDNDGPPSTAESVSGVPVNGLQSPTALKTATTASGFNYYKFTSSDAVSNPVVKAFNVGFGQAVAVKVFVHQWFTRTPTSQTQPAADTSPASTTPEKVYCSTPLDQTTLKDLGAKPAKPFDVKGLEEFKQVESEPVRTPERVDSGDAPRSSGGGAPSGGPQSSGGGEPRKDPAPGQACTAGGKKGTCITTNACTQKGGTSYSSSQGGTCTQYSASNIQCCVVSSPPLPQGAPPGVQPPRVGSGPTTVGEGSPCSLTPTRTNGRCLANSQCYQTKNFQGNGNFVCQAGLTCCAVAYSDSAFQGLACSSISTSDCTNRRGCSVQPIIKCSCMSGDYYVPQSQCGSLGKYALCTGFPSTATNQCYG